ncbi:MAG: hypothetical protein K2R98_16225 [Gemmataceae bacterium]|nr:hypothetical protein [Gemmataceae bacterium]
MTEAEWLTAAEPAPMLEYLTGKLSERKARLFAAAVCRLVWPLLTDERNRAAVEVAERYADGTATARQIAAAHTAAAEALNATRQHSNWAPYWTTSNRAASTVFDVCVGAVEAACRAAIADRADRVAAYNEAQSAGCSEQAALLRHIVGNPFRRLVPPDHWPSAIPALAQALYNGEDCAFALHDALLDAGHADLAMHFQERAHPRGCWALDAILGRQ